MFYQGTLCREPPPPLQLGTPTGPIRGRLGSWYPSIIWKNLQVCIHAHHGPFQVCVRVYTPRVPYYKIGSHIHTGPLFQDRVPYAHHRNLQVCVRVHTPRVPYLHHQEPPSSPSVCNTHHGSHMHRATILLQYYQGILQYYQGTGCTAKVQVVLQRYWLYRKGTGCTAKVQVVLQRYRLYCKVCVGSSGSYEYTHHKVCVYTHHKGNTVVLNNTNTNW